MTSPFDSKNRVAAALDRLALRVLLFVLSVGYFFFLWHSGALSLLAGSALFILAMLTLLLLERRTLARRGHALRVRCRPAPIALEELMLLPAAQAEKRVCALLAQTLGGNARDSVLTYANKTYLVRCAPNPVRLFRRRRRCAGRAPRPDCLGNGILHSSLNRRLFPIRSACRRVDGTAGSPDCRPSTGAAFRPATPRYRRGNRPPCASAANAIFPQAHSRAGARSGQAGALSARRVSADRCSICCCTRCCRSSLRWFRLCWQCSARGKIKRRFDYDNSP